MGSANLHKQQVSGLGLTQYLSNLGRKFRLTPSGEVLGMEAFQHNARGYEKRYSTPGEDYTQDNSTIIDDPEVVNIDPANDTDLLDVWKHIYPPHLLYPPKDNFIELHGEMINLNDLSSDERKQTVLEWQSGNIWDFEQEQSPMGYILSLIHI